MNFADNTRSFNDLCSFSMFYCSKKRHMRKKFCQKEDFTARYCTYSNVLIDRQIGSILTETLLRYTLFAPFHI